MYTLPDCIIFQHEGFAKRVSALIAVVVITLLIYESSDNFTDISGSSSSLSVNPGHVFTRHRKKTCATGTRRAYPRVLIIGNRKCITPQVYVCYQNEYTCSSFNR